MRIPLWKFQASAAGGGRRRPKADAARALVLALGIVATGAERTLAVPSFAVQTGQPCAACHVGAFGPQLKPYGRDFKLHGYVASDGLPHGPPIAATTMTSFTHSDAPQSGGAAPGFAANDNFALDQTSLYYAGAINPGLGAFLQFTYDGVAKQAQLDNADVRHAGEGELFGQDMVWGITANNNPTVQDLWNSTPAWGFPYNSSPLAPTPMAATLVDGGLAQRVAGAGAYMLWNELIYGEFDAYGGLNRQALWATGIRPAEGPRPVGVAPYGRIAVLRDWGGNHLEIGGYALSANVVPAGAGLDDLTDRLTDVAADASYQYIVNPAKVTSDMLSAHATLMREWGLTPASEARIGAQPGHLLTTARADVSYSFGATFTPTAQLFQTTGSRDAGYWSTPNGSPNTSGMALELAYTPWGKPDSPFPWLNARLAVQYTNYFQFDGSSRNATHNNSTYVSLWIGIGI